MFLNFYYSIKKNNTLYSKRKLVEYTGRDLGVLIGGFAIGKTILLFRKNNITKFIILISNAVVIKLFILFNFIYFEKILMILLLFSISIGLWNNFRQLWMQDNGLDPTQIIIYIKDLLEQWYFTHY